MAETETETESNSTAATDLLTAVKETIKGTAQPAVIEAVKDFFVQREIQDRTDILVKAFEALQVARKEEQKIKPDHEVVDDDGKIVSAQFTKAKFEEVKKARAKISKIEKAINDALEGNYDKARNLNTKD